MKSAPQWRSADNIGGLTDNTSYFIRADDTHVHWRRRKDALRHGDSAHVRRYRDDDADGSHSERCQRQFAGRRRRRWPAPWRSTMPKSQPRHIRQRRRSSTVATLAQESAPSGAHAPPQFLKRRARWDGGVADSVGAALRCDQPQFHDTTAEITDDAMSPRCRARKVTQRPSAPDFDRSPQRAKGTLASRALRSPSPRATPAAYVGTGSTMNTVGRRRNFSAHQHCRNERFRGRGNTAAARVGRRELHRRHQQCSDRSQCERDWRRRRLDRLMTFSPRSTSMGAPRAAMTATARRWRSQSSDQR